MRDVEWEELRYEVPLLGQHKTHNRLSAPNLWQYAREKYQNGDGITELAGWTFVETCAEELVSDAEIPPSLQELAQWVCDSRSSYRSYLSWIRIPHGRWGYANSIGRTFDIRWGKEKLSSNETQLVYDLNKTYLSIDRSFEKNWKRSRQRWKRQEKKSGRLAEKQQQRKLAAIQELYDARESTKDHIHHLIGLLQEQIEHIDENTITVEGVRTIFDATNELTSRHARLKKALKLS